VATPEATLRAALLPRLRAFSVASKGALKVRSNADIFDQGEPDLECVWQGRYIGIELKSPTGRPSPMQLRKLMSVCTAGGYACVVRKAGRGVFECQPFSGDKLPFTFRLVEELLARASVAASRGEW
jgi:hypothetical protein